MKSDNNIHLYSLHIFLSGTLKFYALIYKEATACGRETSPDPCSGALHLNPWISVPRPPEKHSSLQISSSPNTKGSRLNTVLERVTDVLRFVSGCC